MKNAGMRGRSGKNLAAVVAMIVAIGVPMASAQKAPVADAAAKLSGTWKLNRELSPQVQPARGGGAGRRGAPAFALAGMVPQRGGGRGGGGDASDLTPEQRAAQAALATLQQVAETVTITASADSVTISDGTGERSYAVDGKNSKINIGGAEIGAKSRWDKLTLRQEFSNFERKLIKTWEVDENGRLVLKVRVESMTLNTADVKAVFDRQ